ncbi:unnamed protein product [Trichobilharzia szidati]|nr:unnamed protein product [Trichobilharzia szidati]
MIKTTEVNWQANHFKMAADGKKQLSEEAKCFLKNVEQHDFIRVCVPDLNGLHLSKLVPKRLAGKIASGDCELYSGSITFGPRFEMINIPEILQRKHLNNYLKPDFSTFHPCNWGAQSRILQTQTGIKCNSSREENKHSYSVCSVICDLVWPDNQPMMAYPRTVADRLVKELEDKYNLRLYSAFEPEFRAFTKESVEASFLKPKSQNVAQHVIKPPVPYTTPINMYPTSLLALYEDYFADVDYNMQLARIDIQDYSNEDGEALLEAPLMPTWGLSAADNYFIFKQAAKEIGSKHDMAVSFMTMPLLNSSASGCHYNHSLWYADTHRNAFFDSKDPDKLSVLARHWLAGLLEHLPALTAISCPTVNCYRRLHRHLAPSHVNWDFYDRYMSIRVKSIDEKRTFIENRVPSSAGCSYLIMAATLAAGLDGLERKLQPPPTGVRPGQGGYTEKDVKSLPATLQEALKMLKEDSIFVNKLGVNLVDWFIQIKERGELQSLGDINIKDNREETLAYERYEYFDFT